jgi:hypothetical protein
LIAGGQNGWSLVASEGKPLGYVATRDLAPVRSIADELVE